MRIISERYPPTLDVLLDHLIKARILILASNDNFSA